MGLDLATVTGWVSAPAGASMPRAGRWRLKRPADDLDVAAGNLGCHLRDEFCFELPDLVAVEAPLPFFAEHKDDGEPRRRSFESLVLPPMLLGAVLGVCGPYGVPVLRLHANTVRKAFIGKASAGDRKATKQAVVRQAQLERLIPADCFDDNIADAVAVWMTACLQRRVGAPRQLVMVGEAAA